MLFQERLQRIEPGFNRYGMTVLYPSNPGHQQEAGTEQYRKRYPNIPQPIHSYHGQDPSRQNNGPGLLSI